MDCDWSEVVCWGIETTEGVVGDAIEVALLAEGDGVHLPAVGGSSWFVVCGRVSCWVGSDVSRSGALVVDALFVKETGYGRSVVTPTAAVSIISWVVVCEVVCSPEAVNIMENCQLVTSPKLHKKYRENIEYALFKKKLDMIFQSHPSSE